MDGYFYYEGGILKHYRTPGSKNGESNTIGYTAQGTHAEMTPDGHYASQYGSTQSQILAKNLYYTGNKVKEQDRIMEDARQKIQQKIQQNPAAYAAKQQVAQKVKYERRAAQKKHAQQLRDSIDHKDDEVRFRRLHRSAAGNLAVDALSDVASGVKKVSGKIGKKLGNNTAIFKSYIRELLNKRKKV